MDIPFSDLCLNGHAGDVGWWCGVGWGTGEGAGTSEPLVPGMVLSPPCWLASPPHLGDVDAFVILLPQARLCLRRRGEECSTTQVLSDVCRHHQQCDSCHREGL